MPMMKICLNISGLLRLIHRMLSSFVLSHLPAPHSVDSDAQVELFPLNTHLCLSLILDAIARWRVLPHLDKMT